MPVSSLLQLWHADSTWCVCYCKSPETTISIVFTSHSSLSASFVYSGGVCLERARIRSGIQFTRHLIEFVTVFLKTEQFVGSIVTVMLARQKCGYGVASTSRLLQIVGLFCKRALKNRRYSTKETYNFKEPTNRSHPKALHDGCVKQTLSASILFFHTNLPYVPHTKM